jgi:hypothetical protein
MNYGGGRDCIRPPAQKEDRTGKMKGFRTAGLDAGVPLFKLLSVKVLVFFTAVGADKDLRIYGFQSTHQNFR